MGQWEIRAVLEVLEQQVRLACVFFFKPIVWIIVVADANARDILMLVNIHVLLDIRCMNYNSS